MLIRIVSALSCAFILAGCKMPSDGPRNAREMYQETIKLYEELVQVLSKVEDLRTASAARDHVAEISNKLARIRQFRNNLQKKKDPNKLDSTDVEFRTSLSLAEKKVFTEYVRIRQRVPDAKKLADEVQALMESQGAKM